MVLESLKHYWKRFTAQDPIIKALLQLGPTPKAVAQSLAALNVRGQRQESRYCPIAYYLRKKGLVLEPSETVVGPIRIWDGLQSRFYSSEVPAVSDFIVGFDEGHYPELELQVSEPQKKFRSRLEANLSKEAQRLLYRAHLAVIHFSPADRAYAKELVDIGAAIYGDFYSNQPEIDSSHLYVTNQAQAILSGLSW